jgi:hypothetical protein
LNLQQLVWGLDLIEEAAMFLQERSENPAPEGLVELYETYQEMIGASYAE